MSPNKSLKQTQTKKPSRITRKSRCELRYKTQSNITYYDRKRKRLYCEIDNDLLDKYFPTKGLNTYDTIYPTSTGLDYNGSESIFKIGNRTFYSPLHKTHYNTTYIYIISKTVGNGLYFKVGEGGKQDYREKDVVPGRLADAQTFLLPGLQNVGYKVHYVFYFLKEYHPYLRTFIGMYIENQIHDILRKLFPKAVLSYPTNNASEWYRVEKDEARFFLGFILDCITLFDDPIFKPLEIWKYELVDKKTPQAHTPEKNMDLLPINQVQIRLRTFIDNSPELQSIQATKDTLRNDVIRMDMVTDVLKTDSLQKRVYKEYNVLQKPKYSIGDYEFILDSIKRPSRGTNDPNSARKMHIVYVGLQKNNENDQKNVIAQLKEKDVIHTIEVIESEDRENVLYFIELRDFLHLEANKRKTTGEYDNWMFKNDYESHWDMDYQDELPIDVENTNETVLLPSFFFEPSVQNYYGEKYIGLVHDDYSVHDLNKVQILSWKIIGYDDHTRMNTRQLYNKETQELITRQDEITIEVISVYKIMNLQNESEKRKKKKTKQWKRAYPEEFEVNHVTYRPKDVIKLRDTFTNFVGTIPVQEMDGQWKKYIIDSVWNDRLSDDLLNPYVDVVKMEDYLANHKKLSKCPKYYLSTPFLSGKIEMVTHAPLQTNKKNYKVGDIVEVTNSIIEIWNNKHFFSTVQGWEISKKETPVHYLRIYLVDMKKRNYHLQLISEPFENENILNNTIKIKDLDKYVDRITLAKMKDPKVKTYIQHLPFFLNYKIERIVNHLPKTFHYTTHREFVKENGSLYLVEWNDNKLNETKWKNRQEPKVVEKYAKNAITIYENSFHTESSSTRKPRRNRKETSKKKEMQNVLVEENTKKNSQTRKKRK